MLKTISAAQVLCAKHVSTALLYASRSLRQAGKTVADLPLWTQMFWDTLLWQKATVIQDQNLIPQVMVTVKYDVGELESLTPDSQKSCIANTGCQIRKSYAGIYLQKNSAKNKNLVL